MITVSQLCRNIVANDHRFVIARLLASRCGDDAVRDRLMESDSIVAAALGLGLQRACELTYWPGSEISSLAEMLIACQRIDGLFGRVTVPPARILGSSAVALRALLEWRALASMAVSGCETRLDDAIERCLSALAENVPAKSVVDDAIVLWQLAGAQQARDRLPLDQMLRRLGHHDANEMGSDLHRLARLQAA